MGQEVERLKSERREAIKHLQQLNAEERLTQTCMEATHKRKLDLELLKQCLSPAVLLEAWVISHPDYLRLKFKNHWLIEVKTNRPHSNEIRNFEVLIRGRRYDSLSDALIAAEKGWFARLWERFFDPTVKDAVKV